MAPWVANRKVYGVHKLWKAARRAGHDLGRDATARLMRLMAIEGVSRRRRKVFTTRQDPDALRAPDLGSTRPSASEARTPQRCGTTSTSSSSTPCRGCTGSTSTASTSTATTCRPQSSKQRSTLPNTPIPPGLESRSPSLHQTQGSARRGTNGHLRLTGRLPGVRPPEPRGRSGVPNRLSATRPLCTRLRGRRVGLAFESPLRHKPQHHGSAGA